MTGIYIVSALTIALSFALVALENKEQFAIKFALKAVASLGFVTVGILAIVNAEYFQNWHIFVLTALIVGMLGDIFLSTGNICPKGKDLDILNLAGMMFFLTGHIIYIFWLAKFVEGFNWWLVIIPIVLPIVVAILAKLKVLNTGKATVPAIAYSAVIGAMLACAINAYISPTLQGLDIGKLILCGGILFSISDSFLAYYNFGNKPHIALKYIYMPSYYIAQILFAFTILY